MSAYVLFISGAVLLLGGVSVAFSGQPWLGFALAVVGGVCAFCGLFYIRVDRWRRNE